MHLVICFCKGGRGLLPCGSFFKFYNRYAGIAFAIFALSEGFDIFDAL